DDLALFIERRLFSQIVGVRMQRSYVVGDLLALGVEPGSLADAVACVGVAGRKIGMPCLGLDARRLRQRCAMGIRSGKAAEVGPLAGALAGNEETHRIVLGKGCAAGSNGQGSQEQQFSHDGCPPACVDGGCLPENDSVHQNSPPITRLCGKNASSSASDPKLG